MKETVIIFKRNSLCQMTEVTDKKRENYKYTDIYNT